MIDGTTAPVDPTPTPTPTPPPDDDLFAKGLALLNKLGPSSGSGPDAVVAYNLIQEASQDSCREAREQQLPEDSQDLYHGAAAACLAAFFGKSERWGEAEEALAALPARPDGCLDRATFDFLEAAVNAHGEFPTAAFGKAKSAKVELPCPTIDEVTVTRDADGALAIQVRGDRLKQVTGVTYSFVEGCPGPEGLEPEREAELVTSERTSLHATAAADQESASFTSVVVAIIAVPEPWMADSECVAITDA